MPKINIRRSARSKARPSRPAPMAPSSGYDPLIDPLIVGNAGMQDALRASASPSFDGYDSLSAPAPAATSYDALSAPRTSRVSRSRYDKLPPPPAAPVARPHPAAAATSSAPAAPYAAFEPEVAAPAAPYAAFEPEVAPPAAQYAAFKPEVAPPAAQYAAFKPEVAAPAAPAAPYAAFEPEAVAPARPYAAFEPEAADADAGLAAAPAPAVAAPPTLKAELESGAHLITRPMQKEYVGEQFGTSEADKNGHLPTQLASPKGMVNASHTRYATSRDEYGTDVVDGRLTKKGAVVSSREAWSKGKRTKRGARKFYLKDRDEEINYAMDGSGGLFTGDVRRETIKHLRAADAEGRATARFNHTTMVGGADVAAAGTMAVRDGKVETLTDSSGHYRPAIAQTYQAMGTLKGKGVMDPERSTVRLTAKGAGQRQLDIRGSELEAYGPHIRRYMDLYRRTGDASYLGAAEAGIRRAHSKQGDVHEQLSEAAEGVDWDGLTPAEKLARVRDLDE